MNYPEILDSYNVPNGKDGLSLPWTEGDKTDPPARVIESFPGSDDRAHRAKVRALFEIRLGLYGIKPYGTRQPEDVSPRIVRLVERSYASMFASRHEGQGSRCVPKPPPLSSETVLAALGVFHATETPDGEVGVVEVLLPGLATMPWTGVEHCLAWASRSDAKIPPGGGIIIDVLRQARKGMNNGMAIGPLARMIEDLLEKGDNEAKNRVGRSLLPGAERLVPRVAVSEGWAQVEIAVASPTVAHRARCRQPTVKAGDSGSLLRYPHRWAVDKRIFGVRRREKGGTILIDHSGSMQLDGPEIASVLAKAPAATIAAYAGPRLGESGRLVILAKLGRTYCGSLGRRDLELGYGNEVDGPCLEWLGRQARPRLWVSDGEVTAKGDMYNTDCTNEAGLLRRRFRIARVPSMVFLMRQEGLGAIFRRHYVDSASV